MCKIEFDISEIKNYAEKHKLNTNVYIGCDSVRLYKKKQNKYYVKYTTTVIFHINNSQGGKVFGAVEYENIYDNDSSKPFNRLWKEAEKVVEIYNTLKDVLKDRYVELHIDINPNEIHGSNIVHNAAVGFIKGTTGITPKVKPEAFAASSAADRYCSLLSVK